MLFEDGNAGGEPVSATCGADEEHRARAVSWWYRRQHVVNLEVAVQLERDTGGVGAVARGSTKQCSKYALTRRSTDTIAASQH